MVVSHYITTFYCDNVQCIIFIVLTFLKIYKTFFIIDEYAYLFAAFGFYRITMHILLTLAEMVILKILYMYKFSIIAAIDEYFFTNFITLFNILINFGFTIIRVTLGENRRTRIFFHNFGKPTEVYNRVKWP